MPSLCTCLSQVAEDNYEALQNFFTKFPSFLSNDFYVFAESYGGIYGPTLAQKIVANPGSINFKVEQLNSGHRCSHSVVTMETTIVTLFFTGNGNRQWNVQLRFE